MRENFEIRRKKLNARETTWKNKNQRQRRLSASIQKRCGSERWTIGAMKDDIYIIKGMLGPLSGVVVGSVEQKRQNRCRSEQWTVGAKKACSVLCLVLWCVRECDGRHGAGLLMELNVWAGVVREDHPRGLGEVDVDNGARHGSVERELGVRDGGLGDWRWRSGVEERDGDDPIMIVMMIMTRTSTMMMMIIIRIIIS